VITPKLKPEWNIHGIVVPEFGGLAHLPDDPEQLGLVKGTSGRHGRAGPRVQPGAA
jgi:hypothetical protein